MKFTTGKARLSYAHIFKTYANEGNAPKYSCSLLFPKSDKKNIERLKQTLKEMLADPDNRQKWGTSNAAALKMPLRDGDAEKPDDQNYKGMYFLNASANPDYPPKVVLMDRTPVADPSEVYSGCWVQAVLDFYAYNSHGNKGIGVGLRGIRKLKDDKPFTKSEVSDSDFSDDFIDDDDMFD